MSQDEPSLRELGQSASDVTRALNELLNHVKDGHSDKIPDIMEQIMTASGELIASYDSSEMVRQARILAQSTAELIQAIKGEAETQSDSDLQVRGHPLPLFCGFFVYFLHTKAATFFEQRENFFTGPLSLPACLSPLSSLQNNSSSTFHLLYRNAKALPTRQMSESLQSCDFSSTESLRWQYASKPPHHTSPFHQHQRHSFYENVQS